jgi:hypothetical protein
LHAPLAGFSVIESTNIAEVVRMVANTPCARVRSDAIDGASAFSSRQMIFMQTSPGKIEALRVRRTVWNQWSDLTF